MLARHTLENPVQETVQAVEVAVMDHLVVEQRDQWVEPLVVVVEEAPLLQSSNN